MRDVNRHLDFLFFSLMMRVVVFLPLSALFSVHRRILLLHATAFAFSLFSDKQADIIPSCNRFCFPLVILFSGKVHYDLHFFIKSIIYRFATFSLRLDTNLFALLK